jgi:hypothetical protein
MHLRCTQVHENALRLCVLCIGVGIGIGIAIETDYDTGSDPEVIQTLRSFSAQALRRSQGCAFLQG